MQKAKKMSKQTLVIAVLAILLVLSLALSVTGAWFTDTAKKDNTTTIQFATVAVNAEDITSEATIVGDDDQTETLENVKPGDSVSFSGTINNTGSTVDIYLGIALSEITFKVYYAGGSTTLSTELVDEHEKEFAEYVNITPLTVGSLPANVEDKSEEDGVTLTELSKLYLIEASETGSSLSYAGSIDFIGDPTGLTGKKSFDNYSVEEDGTVYVFNNTYSEDELAALGTTVHVVTSLEVYVKVEVVAIQADNIEIA